MSEPPKIADELTNLPHVNVANLEPFQGDLKELSKREYSKLKKSLNENGVIVPFFVWLEENKLLDGHQRQRVFVSENWLIDVPVVYISADSEQDAKKKLLVISSQYGKVTQEGWDEFTFDLDDSWIKDTVQFDALPFVFGDLEEGEPEQDSGDAEPQIGRAEELRKEWGVELGQMWRLPSRTPGQEHRLICGDCTDEAVVVRVMGGEVADLVFTDPPYNVAYQSNESIESLKARNRRTDGLVVENDAMSDEEFDSFLFAFLTALPIKNGGAYYLCAPPGRPETQFRNALNCVSGLELRECIVWVKDRFVFGRQDYHWRHESILYGWKDGAAHYFVDDRTQDTVWEIERPSNSKFHPTMKPIALPERAIKNSSMISWLVYDPFSGSGTTIVAAENLSRQCRAVEISPAYVAVALQRYKDAFGIEPELIVE